MATFGLTPQGFVIKRQQDIITEMNASLQNTFGQNINLGPESVFGQLVGIFSEQCAEIWELAGAVYASQYPSGAEGTSVDNILALNNLKRQGATPSKTNPEALTQGNGITLFGLVLFGTAGTVVPKGSIISTNASPPLNFTLDNAVTITAAVNAVQSLFFSAVPNTGAFELSIQDAAGNTLTTPSMSYTLLANSALLNISTTPGSSSGFKLVLTQTGSALTTGTISTNSAYPTASAIQTAIRALSGYSSVTVTNPSTGNYVIAWGSSITNPVLTVSSNTTGASITPTDSLQANINNLHDTVASTNHYPYSDVSVTGAFNTGFVVTFGALSPTSGNISSGSQQQALFVLAANTLFNGATFVNVNIANTTVGSAAQGVGTATCTVDGPNFVTAGNLNTIGSPIAGWSSVDNQLDVIQGTNAQNDTQSLQFRTTELAANANGPLQAIVEKVALVNGVTSAIGFENLTLASQQILAFSSTPTTGGFTIQLGPQTTSTISVSGGTITASQIQTAIRALSGYSSVNVTGSLGFGFVIDFNGANGGQPQSLAMIPSNTLNNSCVITPLFGRPGKSIEIVVQGGANSDIANAIYTSKPGGIQAYGNPVYASGNASSGNPVLSSLDAIYGSLSSLTVGMLVTGPGIPLNTFITNISSNSVTLSQNANSNETAANYYFTYTQSIEDSQGNSHSISFSRPTEVAFYVTLSLVTDTYNTPGDNTSGLNPNAQFNPASISQIQTDLLSIGNAVPVGGRVVGFGTNGLIGAFNSVPGIVGYTLYFDEVPSPAQNNYIQLSSEQVPIFETFNTQVSYS